jgi:transcription antitermination factor NusG
MHLRIARTREGITVELTDAWYAIHVRPRFERTVASMLTGKGYEHLMPMQTIRRQWSDRVKQVVEPLFPGYVFCRLSTHAVAPIIITPGVIRIVGAGNRPLPLDEHEIAALQTLMRSQVNATPWPYFSIGQKVRIETGALAGLTGFLCRHANGDRLVVSVTLLQRSVAVEVERASVVPVPDDAPASTLAAAALARRAAGRG